MAVELVDGHLLGLRQDVQADLEGRKRREDVGAHEVCQREFRVGRSGEDRAALVQVGHAFAGEVVEAHQAAAVGIALERLFEQLHIELGLALLYARQLAKFKQEIDPGVDVRGAVVAVHHRHRRARGGGDHVDLPVYAEGLFRDDHGKVRGAGRHVAGFHAHGVRRRHAGARVALAGGDGDAGSERPARVEQARPRLGECAAALAGGQDLRQNVAQADAGELFELLHHFLVIVQLPAVDGEHAGGLAHAHDLLAGELPVDVAGEGREISNAAHMRFPVQIRLVQVRNAPALGDVEAEELRELFRRLAGDGVAPGAKFRKLLCVPVEGQVAVHHGGYADGAHRGELHAEFGLDIGLEIGKAGLNSLVHHVHGIGPDAVYQLVFPLKIPLGDGDVLLVDQYGLDAGRAQFNAERGFCKIHGFSLL